MMNLIFLFLATLTIRTHAQIEIAYDSLTDIHQYSFRAQLHDYNSNDQQNSYQTVNTKGTSFLFNGWQRGGAFRRRTTLALPCP